MSKSLPNHPLYPEFVARFQNDPLGFVLAVCNMAVSPDQAELLTGLINPNARISVVSGTGTGKTAMFGRIVLWHLLCFPVARYDGKTEIGSNTYIGAPSIQQVGDGVWKEIADSLQAIQSNPFAAWLYPYIEFQAERVYVKGFKEQWFATKFAMQRGQSVSVAGKHRFWQMIIVDEAAGVADEHFDVINGTQTQGGNRTLMASQGVRQAGFFYRSHHDLSLANGGEWNNLCFNSENSPFVTKEWLKSVEIQAGGRDTTEYRVRVLGKFAENEHENLLTRADVEARFPNPNKPRPPLIGDDEAWGWLLLVDVGAGEYRDDSVCWQAKVIGHADFGEDARRVEYTDQLICTNGKNLREFAGLIMERHRQLSNARVVVDVGGIGMELAKILAEQGADVEKVQWGNLCFKRENKERYFNQRACAMVRWRDATRQGRVSYPDFDRQTREKFLIQASRLPYGFTDTGTARYQMWGKDKMRAKGIKSPDLADAASFAFLERVHYHVSDAALDTGHNQDLLDKALETWADVG